MLFNKFSYLTLSIFSFFFLSSFSDNSVSLGVDYFDIPVDSVLNSSFAVIFNSSSSVFVCMTSLVTSVVLIYGSWYMEHYNNFKFVWITLGFYFSMMILAFGDSFLSGMVGWDGLGIFSVCLIFFYPNKTSFFNGLLTMFFNRLGDVCFLFIVSFFILNLNFSLIIDWNFFSCSLLIVCVIAKSAQFPLSAWLPAAMSAPTPISAMVHSSTLVTAGICILLKIFFFIEFNKIFFLLLILSSGSFLMGGVMAFLELDYKKIIAFSTMSQISMVLFFLTGGFLSIGSLHMFFHAIFKTILFCSAGYLFFFFYGCQNWMTMKSNSSQFFIILLMILSIFSMSGLTFSSSFYSKDLFLESISDLDQPFLFLCCLIGSILTMAYCSKLLCPFLKSENIFLCYLNKSNFNVLILVVIMILFFMSSLMKNFFSFMDFFVGSSLDTLILFCLIFFSIFFNFKFSSFKMMNSFFQVWCFGVGGSKFFFFSFLQQSFSFIPFSFSINENFFLKESILNSNFLKKKFKVTLHTVFFFLFFFSLVILSWF